MLKKLPKEIRVAINICLAGIDAAIKHSENDKDSDISITIRNALMLEILQFNMKEDYSSFKNVKKYFNAMKTVFDNALNIIEQNQNEDQNEDLTPTEENEDERK